MTQVGSLRVLDPHASPAAPLSLPPQPRSVSDHPRINGVPTAEANPDLPPKKARGVYPVAGIYEEMDRQNATICAGLTRIEYFTPSLDWRPEAPEDATTEEKHYTDRYCEGLDEIPGRLPTVIRLMFTAPQHGASIQELIYREDPSDGCLLITDTQWIRPGSISEWLETPSGRVWGFNQRGRDGKTVPISLGQCLVVRWRDRGDRAPEGLSLLRPLVYPNEAKRQELVDDRITRQRHGRGTLEWDQPTRPGGTTDKAELDNVERISALWESGELGYIIRPPGWKSTVAFGTANAPDPIPRLNYYDQQASRLLDDSLADLGHTRYGSHAMGSELRIESQRQFTGICREFAARFDQQVTARVWRANGWPGRYPRLQVDGFDDAARLELIVQLAQAGLIDVTDRVKRQIARAVGLKP